MSAYNAPHPVPTPEDTPMRTAYLNGYYYAQAQRAMSGQSEGDESPLSGEWADAPTASSVYESATGENYPDTLDDENGDVIWELCESWERGYHTFYSENDPELTTRDEAITPLRAPGPDTTDTGASDRERFIR